MQMVKHEISVITLLIYGSTSIDVINIDKIKKFINNTIMYLE
jgi:hypothetical protein